MRNTPPSRVAGGCGVFQTGLKSPKQGTSPRDDPDADFRQPQKHVSARVSHVLLQEKPTLSLPALRFPNLFPPLKPETVARRTVEAVQLNQALLLLPWTMHALIILKRYRAGGESSGSDSCQPSPLSPVDPGGEEAAGRRRYTCDRLVMSVVGVKITSGGMCAVDLLSLLWSSSSQTC